MPSVLPSELIHRLWLLSYPGLFPSVSTTDISAAQRRTGYCARAWLLSFGLAASDTRTLVVEIRDHFDHLSAGASKGSALRTRQYYRGMKTKCERACQNVSRSSHVTLVPPGNSRSALCHILAISLISLPSSLSDPWPPSSPAPCLLPACAAYALIILACVRRRCYALSRCVRTVKRA